MLDDVGFFYFFYILPAFNTAMIDVNLAEQPTVSHSQGETKSAEFEVVREDGRGRPLFLTARRFIRICRRIEEGESASEACRLELVHYTGFRRHVRLNPKYQRRLKQAEETREDFLREYHIANIRKHAPKNLLASLWWLERTLPGRFALRTVHRDLNANDQPLFDRVSADQLAADIRLAQQVASEPPQLTNNMPK